MLRKCSIRIEGHELAEGPQAWLGDDLLRQCQSRHFAGRRQRVIPRHRSVLDRHFNGIGLHLDHEIKHHVSRCEIFAQATVEVVVGRPCARDSTGRRLMWHKPILRGPLTVAISCLAEVRHFNEIGELLLPREDVTRDPGVGEKEPDQLESLQFGRLIDSEQDRLHRDEGPKVAGHEGPRRHQQQIERLGVGVVGPQHLAIDAH